MLILKKSQNCRIIDFRKGSELREACELADLPGPDDGDILGEYTQKYQSLCRELEE